MFWHDEVSHALSCAGDAPDEWGLPYKRINSDVFFLDDVHFCMISAIDDDSDLEHMIGKVDQLKIIR